MFYDQEKKRTAGNSKDAKQSTKQCFSSFWMKKVVYFLRVMKSIRRFANTISTKHGWKVFTEKEMHTLTHALKHAHTRSDTLIHTFSLALSDSPSLSHTRTHARTRTMLRSCRVNTPIHTSSAIKAVSERERARERMRESRLSRTHVLSLYDRRGRKKTAQ